jgi:stalled ribosome alternative rescue factor ArfA
MAGEAGHPLFRTRAEEKLKIKKGYARMDTMIRSILF